MRIFVFGSNLSGMHMGGSAKFALENCGAIWGQGVGPQGQSYAIPTLDEGLQRLPLPIIENHVKDFIEYARRNPRMKFNIVAIGCGIAGFTPEQIAPMFKNPLRNFVLPKEFLTHNQKEAP